MNKDVVEVTEETKSLACDFCHRSTVNSLEWGPLYRYQGVKVHYFCLLFSAGLSQNGADDNGILGFLPPDIKKELRRGDKLKCKVCKLTRATIGCSVKNCKASYHYPCGLEAQYAFHFIGNFESYCVKHKDVVDIPLPKDRWECPICYVKVTKEDIPMWPPCCKKCVFHKRCILEMARNSGVHFFKCPLCNDKDLFAVAMRKAGIYLPDRDASWETGNAFADHQRLYNRCDAPECLCRKGRDYSSESDRDDFKIIRCGACGAAGTHKRCSNLTNLTWRCETCSRILSCGQQSSANNSSRIQRQQMESASESDGEDIVRNIRANSQPVISVRDAILPRAETSKKSRRSRQTSESSEDNSDSGSESDSDSDISSVGTPLKIYQTGTGRYVVEDDVDEDSNQDRANDEEEEDSDSGPRNSFFISPQAEKILRVKRPDIFEQSKPAKDKVNSNEPGASTSPLLNINIIREESVSLEDLSPTPTLPPLGKDSLIKTKPKEKVQLIDIREPEIISESARCVKVMLTPHGIFPVGKPYYDKGKDSNNVEIVDLEKEVVDLEEEDDGSDIEVISEKIAPVPATKSSTLLAILNESSSRPIPPPSIRPSPFQISNAFLTMINEAKKRKANAALGISYEYNPPPMKASKRPETIQLDSDDEETTDNSTASR